MQEMHFRSLSQEDFLEEEIATHSSIPAWEISWTEEPGRLQSMGLKRVGHDSVTIFSHSEGCLFTLLIVSFLVQKLLILIRPHLFIFAFISNIVGSGSWKILL